MNRDIAISQKRGCDKNSLNLIIVKADVNSISKIFIEYFELKVHFHSNLKQYLEEETPSSHYELQDDLVIQK